MTSFKRVIVSFFFGVFFLFYQAISQSTSLDLIQHRKKIYVGMATVYEFQNPLSFKDLVSGAYSGLEIELVSQIASKLGVKLVIVPTKWDRFRESLKYGKIDLAIQQIFAPKIDDEILEKDVAYSISYFRSSLAILCRSQRDCSFSNIRKHPNKMGSYNDPANIALLSKMKIANFKTYDLERRLYSAFFAGSIDYIFYDRPLISGLCDQGAVGRSKRCKIIPVADSNFNYSIMVSKDAQSLLLSINETIANWSSAQSTILKVKKINHE